MVTWKTICIPTGVCEDAGERVYRRKRRRGSRSEVWSFAALSADPVTNPTSARTIEEIDDPWHLTICLLANDLYLDEHCRMISRFVGFSIKKATQQKEREKGSGEVVQSTWSAC